MTKLLRAAAVAVPAALASIAPFESANANPMVAIPWLWVAGLGGLGVGFLTGNAYANQTVSAVTPAPVAAVPYQCRRARILVQGRWHRTEICD